MGCKMPWWAGSENPPPDKDKIISDLRSKLTAAEQRAAEAEKDAGRYHVLRDQDTEISVCRGFSSVDIGSTSVATTYDEILWGDALDAAIDAIASNQTKGE